MVQRTTEWPAGQQPTVYGSLEEFLSRPATPPGNTEIMHRGLPIHVNWVDRGGEATLVIFSAAVSGKIKTVPIFSGKGSTADLSANVLMVSDPSLKLHTRLTLSWYAGNRLQPDLQDVIAKIIVSFAGDSRLVLFGGSGGGFAALELAPRIPGSVALVSNPQTDIAKYEENAVSRYLEVAWGGVEIEMLPARTSVLEQYSQPIDAKIVYMQNDGDALHAEHHRKPFIEHLHQDNGVIFLTPSLGEGHIGPGRQSFTELFRAVTEEADWDRLRERLSAIPLTR